jgi:hypothetical protein
MFEESVLLIKLLEFQQISLSSVSPGVWDSRANVAIFKENLVTVLMVGLVFNAKMCNVPL